MAEEAPAIGPTEKLVFTFKAENKPPCPECGSFRVFKSGKRKLAGGLTVQRWFCKDCCTRFSESPLNKPRSKKENDAHEEIVLMEVQGEGEKRADLREPTETAKTGPADVKGKIIEFAWWMKKHGYSESTILSKTQILKRLVKLGANLYIPDSASDVIAQQDHWTPGRKSQVAYAYALFAKWAGLKWEIPQITVPEKLPFIPLEREIDDLIAGCTKHVALALQIAKETGARVGEIYRLTWMDVDFENKTIRITPEKGGKPRIFKISSKLYQMLNNIPKTGKRILARYKSINSLRRTFERQRRKTAFKLGNPRLLQISFHTLRHWKATMEYAKTKDILHVMQLLGHRNIKNTLKYTQLAKFSNEDEFICKVAQNPKEIAELIEAGFEYVCEKDGLLYFRKRK